MDLKEASNRTTALVSRHPWELARLEVCMSLLKNELAAANESGGFLLDMGCGDTWFLEQLLAAYPNINYLGVDIYFTDVFISQVNAKHKGKIVVGKSLDQVEENLGQKPIAIVLLLDVIEHIKDDIGFMSGLFRASSFNHDTRVLITVPAFQALFSKHDVFLEHYRRYNNALLKKNTAASGLQVTRIGYFFSSLLFLRSLGVAKERMLKDAKETTGLVEWKKGAGISALFRAMLVADYKVTQILRGLGLKLPGLSNYAVCKKSA